MTDPGAAALLRALRFAAQRHRDQRRKDVDASPYVNHPIEVAELLARTGGVDDIEVLQAAVLHDVVEDTETTPDEIEALFGTRVRQLVEEVSDDKSLPKHERKRQLVETAPTKSAGARQIILADKICNVRDLLRSPPVGWSAQRCQEYVDWAGSVVEGCRSANPALAALFERVTGGDQSA